MAALPRLRNRPMVAAPTVFEAQRLLLHRMGNRRVQRWLSEVGSSVDLVLPEPDDYTTAIDIAQPHRDQDLTLLDRLLYAISEHLAIPIWTYDHHFDILRANRWQP